MAQPQARPKPRPYRDFLTPSLHRRFTTAALWSILGSASLAAWMSSRNGFWGFLFMSTFRTAALFICPLAIYVLRVGNIHVGSLVASSPFVACYTSCIKGFPLVTFGWYAFSAAVFVETYIWAASEDAMLDMVDRSKYERPRLNERPVFLRTMFLYTAFVQSTLHLYLDRDRVILPTTDSRPQGTTTTMTRLRERGVAIFQRPLTMTIALVPSGVLVYFVLLRRTAASCALLVAKQIYRLPKHNAFTGVPGLMTLIANYAFAAFLLLVFWELTNILYDIQISKPPLKRDLPLTSDSKDPNGSLILGLRARKEFARHMALWELVQITHRFDARRQTIFAEYDREGGSAWSQVSQACLGEIKSIGARIAAFNNPVSPPPPPAQPQIESIPRLGPALKGDGDIYAKSTPKSALDSALDAFGNFAKAHGNSPGSSPISPRAKRLLEDAQKMIAGGPQKQPQSGQAKATAGGVIGDALRSPLGLTFRQTFDRRATAVVCGSPVSRTAAIVAASDAVTELVVHSLKEDRYGAVQKDVLTVFKTFSGTLQSIQKFLQTLPPHWSDVGFKERDRRQVREINEIQEALRKGLEKLLMAFGEYLGGLGASATEVREAKAMVAQPEKRRIEMQQAR